jgi:hypothetical protein
MFQLRRSTESLSGIMPTISHQCSPTNEELNFQSDVLPLVPWMLAVAQTLRKSDDCEMLRAQGQKMQGARVLILTGRYKGEEGVCLGDADRSGLWAISPDHSDEVISLAYEKDFGLLVDLSGNPQLN